MNRVFSRAAIERIARVVQLPGKGPASAAGLVRQATEDKLHEHLVNLEANAALGIWLGDDDEPALRFVSFAGFLELGIQSGYLSLKEWEDAPALKEALPAFLASPSAKSGAVDLRLLGALLHRLEQAESGPRSKDAIAFASFESYLHLTSRLRADAPARAFLEETQTAGYPDGHVIKDLSAFLTPRHFAEAFSTRAIAGVPVTDVAAGVGLLRYFEWFAEIRNRLDPESKMRAGLVRHARWAHEALRVRHRFDMWVEQMREWTEETAGESMQWWLTANRTFRQLGTEQVRWRASKGALSTAPPPSGIEPEPINEEKDRSAKAQVDRLLDEGRDAAARKHALRQALQSTPQNLDPDAPDFFDRVNRLVGKCLALAELGQVDAAAAIVAPIIPAITRRFRGTAMVSDALSIVARARRGPRAEADERKSEPAAKRAQTTAVRETEENRYLAT